ncbi:Glucoamylase [Methanosarcina mazei TMA]|nr:Glucoamylase [Methanosarcina mazei TMA]
MGIRISILDLVHPGVPVLIRRFKVQSQRKIYRKIFLLFVSQRGGEL